MTHYFMVKVEINNGTVKQRKKIVSLLKIYGFKKLVKNGHQWECIKAVSFSSNDSQDMNDYMNSIIETIRRENVRVTSNHRLRKAD